MLRAVVARALVVNVIVLALGIVNSILLARWLGPAGRGEVAAALLWPTLLMYFGSTGLIQATLYFATQESVKVGEVLGSSLAVAVAQSAVAMAIGFVALPWLLAEQRGEVVWASRLLLWTIPLGLATQYGVSTLQGRSFFNEANLLRPLIPTGYLFGTLALHASGRLTLPGIVWLFLSLNGLALATTWALLRRTRVASQMALSGSLTRAMLGYGFKVQVGDISQGANLRMDQMLMAAWLPAVELGLYVTAVSAAGLAQVVSTAVRWATVPVIAQQGSAEARLGLLTRVFRQYWLLSLLATAGLAVFLPFAIPLVYGAEFQRAVWPAEVLLLGAFLLGARDVLGGGAMALGQPWLSSRADLAGLVVTVALLALLLPTMGILGAALASVGAYAVQLATILYGLHRTAALHLPPLFRVGFQDLRTLALLVRR